MRAKSSNDTGQTCPTMETSKTSPQKLWPTPTSADAWSPSTMASAKREWAKNNLRGIQAATEEIQTACATSLQEDFLANLSALPGSAEARAMTVRSGRRCSALLQNPNPAGCLVKMLLESSAWNSTVCFLTWKISATPSGRLLFRLVPSMPNTDETECGLWPTPTSRDHKDGTAQSCQNVEPNGLLGRVIHLFPTPVASSGAYNKSNHPNAKIRPSLRMMAKKNLWPTPHANCHTGPGQHGTGGQNLQTSVSGSLNPQWVEWLMGYPIGHTDLKDSVTPSSQP